MPPKRAKKVDAFGPRGQRLWDGVTAGRTLGEPEKVLLEEACRTADRLDKLDGLLTRREPWDFYIDDAGTEVTVSIDNALVEARQQGNALRQIIATLGLAKAKPAEDGEPEGDPIDEVNRRRQQREAG